MIAYMPEILPDETVYSWFCRYFIHTGYPNSAMAQEEIFCKRSCNPSTEFIGNIKQEVREILNRSYGAETIVRNHTMYPQYARFIPIEKKKRALHSLAYEFEDAHHLFHILPRQEGERYLRYCPLCATEDRKQYGETFWHRVHQIRDMRICPVHHCRLLESEVAAKSERLYTLCPAEQYVHTEPILVSYDATEIAFAEYLQKVFRADVCLDNPIAVKDILSLALHGTQYMSANGKMRKLELLAQDVKEFYGRIQVGQTVASYYQIQRVLSGSRYDFNVVCQLGFFLGIDAERLLMDTMTTEERKQLSSAVYERKDTPTDWDSYDRNMLPFVEELCRKIYEGDCNKAGRPERVSEKALYRELNIPSHRLERMPKCKAVFEQYTETNEECQERRVRWAYQKLKEKKQNKPIYWSDIRKLAGVKKEKVGQIAMELIGE